MSSPADSGRGAQPPRVSWVPPADRSEGDLVADFAARCGLVLDGWQRAVLRAGLGVHADGGWQARQVTTVVPRQNGKGAIIEARELAALFLFGESCVHTAHEVKTARKAFHRLARLVESRPWLMARVRSIRKANGQESIELRDGTLIEFIARSKGSGRGFTAPLLILDEAMILTDDAMEALTYIQATFGTVAQTWLFGSAPLVESEVLRSACEAGAQGGDPRSVYLEWSVAPGTDLDDRDGWAQANPGFPHRISEQTIVDERTSPVMSDRGFARERLGVADTAKGARVIGEAAWDALAVEGDAVERLEVVAVAFDVSPDQQWGSVAVAGRQESGRWQVGVWNAQPGDGWIVDEVVAAVESRTVCRVTADPRSPAWALVPALAQRGVEVQKVSGQELAAACSGFMSCVTSPEPKLAHLGQPVLDAAVSAARKRTFGEGWAWARKDTSADITPLVAVTLARHGFEQAMAEGWTNTPAAEPTVVDLGAFA